MKKLSSLVSVLGICGLIHAGAGCSSSTDDGANACESEPIDSFKELVIVDESVLADARAKNATAGPWSFRHALENMAPPRANMSAFVDSWFSSWSMKELNGYRLDTPNEERVARLNDVLVCPWLRRTPSNQCDDYCTSCAHREFDLAQAPFRLIAFANRMDVRETIPRYVSGEGRLVFALTDGAADDPASPPLAMTMIFEYVLPESKTPKEWADTWHALGKFTSYDEPFRAALESVTNSFVSRDARPGAVNGSSINQIRTNESVFDWIWQLREFSLAPDGTLALRPVHNTPPQDLNDNPILTSWVKQNASAINANVYELPVWMRAGSADAFRFSWNISGVDPVTARNFANGTCNGCHSANTSVDTAFHVSPFRKGTAKLSHFLWNSSGTGGDDLSFRQASMRRARCSQ